jgi:hypothetical protein
MAREDASPLGLEFVRLNEDAGPLVLVFYDVIKKVFLRTDRCFFSGKPVKCI